MCALGVLAAWAVWSGLCRLALDPRDGTVRVYVVGMAPEVAGKVTELHVADNQFVHRGDLLMVIDPTNYAIAVTLAEAAVAQAKADRDNKQIESQRRDKLTTLSTSVEQRGKLCRQRAGGAGELSADDRQSGAGAGQSGAHAAGGAGDRMGDQSDRATGRLRDGGAAQYFAGGMRKESFWVDGYFEEGAIARIHENDPARIKLMGYKHPLSGHVQGVARAIEVANAQADSYGLASVNPIFTWIRLAQRVPVRVAIDQVPPEVRLVAGDDGDGGDRGRCAACYGAGKPVMGARWRGRYSGVHDGIEAK